MITEETQTILENISHHYKSFKYPDFTFVNNAITSNPYHLCVKEIASVFNIEEITDPNDDVSFCYKLTLSEKNNSISFFLIC